MLACGSLSVQNGVPAELALHLSTGRSLTCAPSYTPQSPPSGNSRRWERAGAARLPQVQPPRAHPARGLVRSGQPPLPAPSHFYLGGSHGGSAPVSGFLGSSVKQPSLRGSICQGGCSAPSIAVPRGLCCSRDPMWPPDRREPRG